MAEKFLNYSGLSYFASKIKSSLSGKAATDLSNVENSTLASKAMAAKVGLPVATTAGTGSAYTATVDGVTSLYAGLTITIIPHVVSASKTPTLNVNSLGAKTIRRRISNSTASTVASSSESWLAANKPIQMTYDGTYWIPDFTRPNATDLYGTMPITGGGTGATTAAAALTNLGAAAKWDTLWENDNPASSFAEQTLTLDGLSDYNLFKIQALSESGYPYFSIECYVPTTSATLFNLTKPIGLSGSSCVWERYVTINRSAETVKFGGGYWTKNGATSGYSNVVIPTHILATKI